jgi:hypothetical protein
MVILRKLILSVLKSAIEFRFRGMQTEGYMTNTRSLSAISSRYSFGT